MFKKYTAYLFICISGIIYAGHSFIPHHHKNSEQDIQVSLEEQHGHEEAGYNDEHHGDEHHDDENHQKNSNEHSDLYDILAHFSHGEPFFKIDNNEIKTDSSKGESVPILMTILVKWVEPISVPERRICCHYKALDYHSQARIPFGLRAPPVVA